MRTISLLPAYKKITSLFAILAITLPSFAQSGWQWATNSLNAGMPAAITTDLPGNIYVAGYAFNTDTSGAGIIAKYNASGALEWVIGTGDTTINCYANSVATDPAGNVYVCGNFQSEDQFFGTDTLYTTPGSNTMFIAKYNGACAVLWAKGISGIDVNAQATSIATDPMGNIFITGCFSGDTLIFDTTKIVNHHIAFNANTNIFIAKYDSSGNLLWAKGAGSTGNEAAYSVVTDAAGNAYVTGIFDTIPFTLGTTTLTNTYLEDMFIAKYSSSGNVIWATCPAGMCNIEATAIDAAGNVYVTGLYGPGNLVFGSTTLSDPTTLTRTYLTKYDTSGNITWSKIAALNAAAASMAVSHNGYVYITGTFDHENNAFIGGTELTADDETDVFLAKYDTSGTPLTAVMAGSNAHDTTESDMGTAVTTDASGNVYVAGSFRTAFLYFDTIADTNVFNVAGNMFLAKTSADIEAVKKINTIANKISVYPNPTTGILDIELPGGQYTALTIYNTLGAVIYKSAINSPETTRQADLQNFPPGVYYVVANGDGNSQTLPFVISH